MESPRSRTACWLLTTAATAVGVGLRWWFSGEPLWIDELHTAWAIDANLVDVAGRAAQGNQTPLYFWLNWCFCQAFGQSELNLRLTSIVCSSATVVLAAMLVHRWSGSAVGAATTAILIGTDQWSVFYGSEARPYALLQCLGVIQVACLMRVCREQQLGRARTVIGDAFNLPLLLSSALLLATHLTAGLLLIAELLFMIVCIPLRRWLRIGGTVFVSSGVLLLLWPTLSSSLAHRTDWQSVSGVGRLFLDSLPSLVSCLAIPAAVVLSLRLVREDPKSQPLNNNHIQLQLALFWALGPLCIAFSLAALGWLPIAAYRYTLVGSVGFPVLAGLVVSRMNSNASTAASCAAILLAAAAFNPLIHSAFNANGDFRHRHEDWKSAVEELQRLSPDGNQLVFLFANLVEDHRAGDIAPDSELARYLRFPFNGIYRLKSDSEILPMPTLAAQRWAAIHLQRITNNRGAQIIARVHADDFQSILDELQVLAIDSAIDLRIEKWTQPGNDLRIADITVAE